MRRRSRLRNSGMLRSSGMRCRSITVPSFPSPRNQAHRGRGAFRSNCRGSTLKWGLIAVLHTVRCALQIIFLGTHYPATNAHGVCERISMREDRGPQLSVPIDAELKARLEAAAAREDRPVASFVRRIVVRALDGEREGAAA